MPFQPGGGGGGTPSSSLSRGTHEGRGGMYDRFVSSCSLLSRLGHQLTTPGVDAGAWKVWVFLRLSTRCVALEGMMVFVVGSLYAL